jgi:hypothetical protein
MTAPAMPRIGERASWDRVLAALEDRGLVARRRGDSRVEFRCPCHDDKRASGTADYQPGDPGRTLLCCHSTDCPGYRNGSPIAAALGLADADLFDGPAPHDVPARRLPRPRPALRPTRPPMVAARPACNHRGKLRPDLDYPEHKYVNSRGELLMRVLRKRCSACGTKDIRPERPGWAEADRVLYRLPEVLAAVGDGRTVYVVEGEKCADALAALGYAATTCPFGAGKWLPQHTAALAGAAHVVVIADNDRDGYSHAAFVAGELGGASPPVELVETVRAAVEAPKADIVDHLAAGLGVEDLVPADALARLAELDNAAADTAPEGSGHGGSGRGTQPPGNGHGLADGDGIAQRSAKWVEVEGSRGWEYRPPSGSDPGEVAEWTGRGDGKALTGVVSWAPEVLGRLVTAADDGSATGRHFEIRVGDDTLVVSNAELRSGEAWDRFPDATGLGAKRVREVMHNVVTGQAKGKPRTLAATRTGWHGSDGQWCYVWPDGRTFPDGRQIRLIGMRLELAEAARPRGEAADDEIRRALADMVKHGRHGAMLGLGAGARSFGQSIRPVPAGLAPWGDPNSGKSSLGWHSRSLAITSKGGRVPGWPPLPTRSFSATRTVLEIAANAEADLPTLFEDLALPADAAAVEVRDANGKIEALIRSVANADEIRGRATRELLPAPANYVRSIPLLTAERMPPVMMASLYRRAVVPRLYLGQIDTAWYAAHSAELLTPLRTIGARVVELLYELGTDAAERLDKYTAAALAELSAAIGAAAWVRDVPAMGGVIDAAAAIVGGLYLVAEVVPGVDPATLTAPAVGYLTEALAEQADVIADRGAHSGSLADATGQVLTRALLARRAHVCDKDGRPVPLVPGLTPSEQGLREVGGHLAPEFEGQGVPLYWLPERGGIGVRSAALHALLVESRDPRVTGLTPRSLPEALLRDGASLSNTTQRDRTAVHRIRVGAADEPTRLVLLRRELLTGDDDPPRVVAISAGTTGTTGTVQVSDLQDGDSSPAAPENGNNAGQGADAAECASEPLAPVEPVTSAVAVVPVVPQRTGTAPGFVTASDRFRAPAVVADAERGYLARPDRVEAVELAEPMASLGHAVGWARMLGLGMAHAAGMPDDPVLVIVPELAARLGLPVSAPDPKSKAAREHPALAELRADGWELPALRSWMMPFRRGYRGPGSTVRVWLPGWDDAGECPMWGDDGVPALDLAYRLGLFAELAGIGWRLTGGVTGIDLLGTFPRRRGRRLAVADPPKPALVPAVEPDFHWSRSPMSDEAALSWLHCYDENAMYLPAYGQAAVNLGGWRHVEAPEFSPKVPGYWLLGELPEPADRLLPDVLNPTRRDAAGRPGGWFVTPTLARAVELGCEIRPREAWLPDDDSGRWYEPLYERLRDARRALTGERDPDSAAVLAAVKLVWHQTHGMFTVRPPGGSGRPDHRHVLIATARAGMSRRLGKIAEAEARWPLAVATDNVAYASADPDPRSACPAGLVLGDGLGQFKHAGTLPMAEALPLLTSGRGVDVTRLFEAARDWQEAHDGA